MDAIERRCRASAEAADWWAILHTDEVSRGDREQFIEWLRESHLHVTEMLRLIQVHGALAQFEEWSTLPAAERDSGANVVRFSHALSTELPVRQEPAVRGSRRSFWLFSMAAGVVVMILGGLLVLPAIRGQVIATERGERRELMLEDGSVVQIDPQTRLRVKYEEQARNVWLTRGRAVFRVAKSPHRPFLVRTEDATVRAVGTAFGVERRDGDVIVTVVEGRVAVSSPTMTAPALAAPSHPSSSEEQAASHAPAAVQPPAEILLSADQQITLRRGNPEPQVHAVEGQQELAWAEGRLIFRNDTVAHVVSEFNRYSRMRLEVTDAALAARRVSGVFDATYPEEFIAFLQGTTPVEIERIEGQTIKISPPTTLSN